jgi:putative endonuclease
MALKKAKKKKPLPKKKRLRIFKRIAGFHVYMLECADGSFYTGYTNDLDKRIALHNKGGGSKYVRTRLPAKLVFCKPYRYYKLAILEERRLKTLTRRQKEKIVAAYLVSSKH